MADSYEDIQAQLAEYIDGLLPPDQRAAIEAHLNSNPSHLALVQELIQQRDAIKSLPREKAPIDLADEIQGMLEREQLLKLDELTETPRLVLMRPRLMALAAMFVLCVGLFFTIFRMMPGLKPVPIVAQGETTDKLGLEKETAGKAVVDQSGKDKNDHPVAVLEHPAPLVARAEMLEEPALLPIASAEVRRSADAVMKFLSDNSIPTFDEPMDEAMGAMRQVQIRGQAAIAQYNDLQLEMLKQSQIAEAFAMSEKAAQPLVSMAPQGVDAAGTLAGMPAAPVRAGGMARMGGRGGGMMGGMGGMGGGMGGMGGGGRGSAAMARGAATREANPSASAIVENRPVLNDMAALNGTAREMASKALPTQPTNVAMDLAVAPEEASDFRDQIRSRMLRNTAEQAGAIATNGTMSGDVEQSLANRATQERKSEEYRVIVTGEMTVSQMKELAKQLESDEKASAKVISRDYESTDAAPRKSVLIILGKSEVNPSEPQAAQPQTQPTTQP